MSPVFLDTVGLIAIFDTSDQWHTVASSEYQRLLSTRRAMLTTSFVMLEFGNAASRRPYRTKVYPLLQKFDSQNRLVIPTETDSQAAWKEYHSQAPSGPSIVDCVSFQVMRRLGLTDVFSNDRHFATAGFTLLF